jgi:hypothetical protein
VRIRPCQLLIPFLVAAGAVELEMRFSRNQIIGALLVLALIWLVIVIRIIIAKA